MKYIKIDNTYKGEIKMIKDCNSCIHNRVCSHKGKNEEYKQQMKELIEKWGEDNGFGFTEDCPEWHSQPSEVSINTKIDEESKKLIRDCVEKDKNKIFKAEDIKVKPVSIRFDNGGEIKTIPSEDNVRGKRAEKDIEINIDNLTSINDDDIHNLINRMIREGIL